MTSPDRYRIPTQPVRVITEVKGSRFIATAAHVPDVDAAGEFVARIKGEFADATHNCWAWVVGPPGSTTHNGSSDDGEPGGTAGLPILNVLLKSGVGDVAVVVTRYFGGVKLGRGGLVRAYGGAAKKAVLELDLTERVTYVPVDVTVDYAAVEAVRRVAVACEGRIAGESFAEVAVFRVDVPQERVGEFEMVLRDATGGKARVERVDLQRGRNG